MCPAGKYILEGLGSPPVRCLDRQTSQPLRLRQIDALLVEAGANDLNFGAVAKACAALSHCVQYADGNSSSRVDAVEQLIDDVASVGVLLPYLPSAYDAIDGAMKSVLSGLQVQADRVFVTEYFDRFDIPGGDSLLVVTTELTDPTYLFQPFWTSTHFKKQADASGWNPTPCAAR